MTFSNFFLSYIENDKYKFKKVIRDNVYTFYYKVIYSHMRKGDHI
jgi:hypothetical protein